MDSKTFDYMMHANLLQDTCAVTEHCNVLTASQKNLINSLRTYQEISEEISITGGMLLLIYHYEFKGFQRDAEELQKLGLVTFKKGSKDLTEFKLNINRLDEFLKEHSPVYDELIGSDGLTYMDIFCEKSQTVRDEISKADQQRKSAKGFQLQRQVSTN